MISIDSLSVYMLIPKFIVTWGYMYIWSVTGEVNAKRIREKYLSSVLRQEVSDKKASDQSGGESSALANMYGRSPSSMILVLERSLHVSRTIVTWFKTVPPSVCPSPHRLSPLSLPVSLLPMLDLGDSLLPSALSCPSSWSLGP